MVANPLFILQELSDQKTLPDTKSSVTSLQLLQSWRSPFPFQRGTTRHHFQSVGMMPVFQTEHRTTCSGTSISTSLEKFSMDATNPRSFAPFHRSLCFHKRRWTLLIGGSAIRIVTPLTSNLTAGGSAWYSRSVTGPAGLHFGLLCQEPTTLCSKYSTPRDRLGGTQCANSPLSKMRIT